MKQTVGVIGVGHLARHLVEGYARVHAPFEIVLSPRNAATSRMLADRFGATIAASSAEVVRRADVVLLATRPPDLIEAACGLPWREDQVAVSLASGVALSGLRRAAFPATAARALPITAAQIGESPTCLHPDNAVARRLFECVGSVHAFDDESVFEAASIHGVIYSTFHAVMQSLAQWLARDGVPADDARELVARTIRAAGGMVTAHPELPLERMVEAFAIPGSLTLTAVEAMRGSGALSGINEALDRALAQARGIGRTTADASQRG